MNNPTIFTEAGDIQEAFLRKISFDNTTGKQLKDLHESKAIKKVEVSVTLNGETKEFSVVDFFSRLGFTEVL